MVYHKKRLLFDEKECVPFGQLSAGIRSIFPRNYLF